MRAQSPASGRSEPPTTVRSLWTPAPLDRFFRPVSPETARAALDVGAKTRPVRETTWKIGRLTGRGVSRYIFILTPIVVSVYHHPRISLACQGLFSRPPRLVAPSQARPGHACLPRPSVPGQAPPQLANPALPCLAEPSPIPPRHTHPSHACHPGQSRPNRVLTSHACYASPKLATPGRTRPCLPAGPNQTFQAEPDQAGPPEPRLPRRVGDSSEPRNRTLSCFDGLLGRLYPFGPSWRLAAYL